MGSRRSIFDIERFIKLIQKYPELWSNESKKFQSSIRKRYAWIEICRVFYEDFDEKDYKDKNEICNKFIKKWKGIKDNYIRSLKKNADNKYARYLTFLQQANATTNTQPSLSVEKEQHKTSKIRSNNKRPLRTKKKSVKRKRNEQSPVSNLPTTLVSSETEITESNPDKSFFESIIPSISDFTEDNKLVFRCEVLNIIKRMRMSGPNISTQSPTYYSANIIESQTGPFCAPNSDLNSQCESVLTSTYQEFKQELDEDCLDKKYY